MHQLVQTGLLYAYQHLQAPVGGDGERNLQAVDDTYIRASHRVNPVAQSRAPIYIIDFEVDPLRLVLVDSFKSMNICLSEMDHHSQMSGHSCTPGHRQTP